MSASLNTELADARRRRRLPSPEECRRLRIDAGVSQLAVAKAIGITRTAVSRYESGDRSPNKKHLAKYEAVLKRLAKEAEGLR